MIGLLARGDRLAHELLEVREALATDGVRNALPGKLLEDDGPVGRVDAYAPEDVNGPLHHEHSRPTRPRTIARRVPDGKTHASDARRPTRAGKTSPDPARSAQART